MAKSIRTRKQRRTTRPAPLEGNAVWRDRSRVRAAGPAQRESSAWERLPPWAQHALCLGFLFLVALGFTAPTTLGGLSLVGGDTVQWRATAQALFEAEAETGQFPLWAPNVFGGMPSYLIHYPAQVPGADTLFSGLRALGLWPLAHLLALFGGVYALVVFLTRSKLAGALSAVAFGLSTYLPIILVAGHNTKFIALAYAPWLLLGFAALIRRPATTGKAASVVLTLLFAIAAAVNLRAGHIQITYYVVVAAAVWWLAEGISAYRLGRLRTFGSSTALLLLGSGLALAMTAHPYLAQWEYKQFSMRGAGPGGGLAWDYAMAWSQGWGEMLTLLVADAYGGGGQLYWGAKPFTAGPHYVGAVVLALAVIGLVGVQRRSVFAFGVAALLMAGFALGSNFVLLNRPAFAALPLFSAFRVPETWLSVVVLLLALLAGWGAYYLQRREATEEGEGRKRRIAYASLGVLGVFLAGLYLIGPSVLALERPGERALVEEAAAGQLQTALTDPRVTQAATGYLAEARGARAEALRGDTGRSLLFLGLAAGLVFLLLTRRVPAYVALGGLALLVTWDLWGVGRRHFNADDPAFQRRPDVAAAIPRTQADDWIRDRVREAGGPGHFRVLPASPTTNAVPSFYFESVGGYHGAKLQIIQDYFDLILPDSAGVNPNALDLLSARYVLAPGVLPGLTPLFQDERTGLVVSENPTALPRAFLVDRAEVVPSRNARIARLRSPDFDPRTAVLLAENPPEGFAEGPPPDSGAVSVQLQRFLPEEIVWLVETDRPRLLVASEVFYPAGWTANVGGEPVPILQANEVIRAVPVPAGRHLVTMRFDPPLHGLSLLISWITSILVYVVAIGLGGLLWYRRGHPPR